MKEKFKIVVGIIIAVALILAMGLVVYNFARANSEEVVNPVATFEIQDQGAIKMELYPEYAPNTVANFIALIEAGYYNNKVLFGKDDICLYMGRDTAEEATGPMISLLDSSVEAGSDADYEYTIKGEFIANEFEQNTLRHEKGVLSLNRADYSSYGLVEEGYNSGCAQFSVMMENSSNLNGVYCAFGKVTEGLEILEKIYNEAEIKALEEGETAEEGTIEEFSTMPVITNTSVEKHGVEYAKPETEEKFDIQAYINELYSQYY